MGIFSRSGSRRHGKPDRLQRWVMPEGHGDDPETEEIKRAAAADVAAMEEEEDTHFRRDGPGRREDDL